MKYHQSPFCINDLMEEIPALNNDIGIGDGQLLSILLYADDIEGVAPDEKPLQNLLDVVNRWCTNGGLGNKSGENEDFIF